MGSIDATAARRHLAIAAIVGLGAALRAWGITYGLPHAYILDETFLVHRTLALGTGDLNPHFFEWPGSLVMYILFIVYGLYFVVGLAAGAFGSTEDFAVAFLADPTPIYLLSRSSMVLLGAAAVYLTYLVGARFYGTRAGLTAAVFLAVSPLVAGVGHFALVDTPLLLFSIAVFLPIAAILRGGGTRNWIVAGVLVGLGTAVKFNATALAIPLLVAHVARARDDGRPLPGSVVNARLGLAFAGIAAGFIVGCPFSVLDAGGFFRDVLRQVSRVQSAGGINREYVSPFLFYLDVGAVQGLGIAVSALCVAGVLLAALRREAADLVCLSFVVPYLVVIGTAQIVVDKYLMPVVPVILVLGAACVEAACRKCLHGRRGGDLVLASVVLFAAASPAMRAAHVSRTLTADDTRTLAKRWIEAHVPPGTRVAIDSGRLDVAKLSPPLDDLPENLHALFVSNGAGRADDLMAGGGAILRRYYELRLTAPHGTRYSLTRIVISSDGRVDEGVDLARLVERGVAYVVVSSFAYEGYRAEAYRANHPAAAAHYSRFYESLGERCVLVKEFPAARGVRQGPTIKIYRTPAASAASANRGAGPAGGW